MVVVLIHIDSSTWHYRWGLARRIANYAHSEDIKLRTKVIAGGSVMRIQADDNKDNEAFGLIANKVLGPRD